MLGRISFPLRQPLPTNRKRGLGGPTTPVSRSRLHLHSVVGGGGWILLAPGVGPREQEQQQASASSPLCEYA
eukprot:14691070-Alexandrium_andersonii.AAC.1